MHRTRPTPSCAAAALALGLALSGCGESQPPAAPPAAARTAPKAVAASGASAQEVAKAARGDLSCPTKVRSAQREAAAPVDDVQGVRPGLTYEEAMGVVLCTHDLLVAAPNPGRGFQLKAAGARDVRQGFGARFAEPRVVRTGKEIMLEMQRDAMARGGNAVREDLQPGQAKWTVTTMGLPGQERVLAVAREERFETDARPTVDAVRQALLAKYGAAPLPQRGAAGQPVVLRWAHDPLGRPVTETSALAHACHGTSDPDGGVNLSPDCGLVVQAMLIPPRDNPALVERLQVGVVDQAGGWRLINATEQGLGQADRQRQAQEIEQASNGAKVPKL